MLPITASLCSVSCLISPPDPIEQLEQVPPFVLTHLAVPTPYAYYPTTSTESPLFHVEFKSEDLGEGVVGQLYLNLDTASEELITRGEVGAGSLNDPQPRSLDLTWRNSSNYPSGCYVITMTITHESNYSNEWPLKPLDRSKTAYIYWWAVHDRAPENLNFDECPAPSPDPPQTDINN